MRDVQSIVVAAGQDAGCQRLVLVHFGQHSAWSAGRVKDLNAKIAGHVITSAFVHGHTVATGRRDIRRRVVEAKFTFRIDTESHRHRGHLRIQNSTGIDSERPRVSPAVVRHGQGPTVAGQCDAVRFGDAGVDGDNFSGFRVDSSHLFRTGLGDQDEAFAGDGQVVGFDSFRHRLHFASADIDGDNSIL